LHHIPNIISVFRILLIIPIALLLHHQSWANAFILILIAGVSDALDGFLARVFNWQSRLGSFLDPIADKLLLIVIFISLAHKGIIPIWLTCLVIGRDLIILLGASACQWITRKLEMSPLFISKVNTALQILFILLIMYHLAFSNLPWQLIEGMQIAVAITTILSGLAYIVIWSKDTKNELTRKKTTKKGQNNT